MRPTLLDMAGNYSDSLDDLHDLHGRLVAQARRDDEEEAGWLLLWAREVAWVARRRKEQEHENATDRTA